MKKLSIAMLSMVLAGSMLLTACGGGNTQATEDTGSDTQQSETAENTEGGVLRMATNATFPPYEYYEGDEVVGIHVHILLPRPLEPAQLLCQFPLVVLVFVLGLVDPFKLRHHPADDVLLVLNQLVEILLQRVHQLRLIQRHRVGAALSALAVVPGADPADVRVFIRANRPAE